MPTGAVITAGNVERVLSTLEAEAQPRTLADRIERLKRAEITRALTRFGGNKTKAAQVLGMRSAWARQGRGTDSYKAPFARDFAKSLLRRQHDVFTGQDGVRRENVGCVPEPAVLVKSPMEDA